MIVARDSSSARAVASTTSRRCSLRFLASSLGTVLVLGACTAGPPVVPDASGLADAGAFIDGGADVDAGSLVDAGGPPDAGPEPDEDFEPGIVDDAGASADAGASVDAGFVVDAGPPPAIQAFFNVPHGDVEDRTLEDKIIELVGRAVPGSQIHVSLFNLTRTRAAQAFIDAAANGVDMQLVLDGQNEANAVYPSLVDALGAGNVTLCSSATGTSCIGTNINHSKYFLFSELDDGSQNVVVQSSANLTRGMLTQHNNLVVVRDDPTLYAGYLAVWQDQRAEAYDPDYYVTVVGERPIRVYFFPRESGDTIVSVLGNVVCTGGGAIRVAMSLFSNGRTAIADALADRARAGCVVTALLKDDGTVPGSQIVPTLEAGGVDVTLFPQTATVSSIHSKYLLIDSLYDTGSGPAQRQLVFTGSHNYTAPALRDNDEQLMRVDDPDVYASFLANWQAIEATTP